MGRKSHCEINAFSSSCWHPIIATSFYRDNSSKFSPIMPEEFGEHLTRDQRPFSSSRISPDPSDSQLHVSSSSLQFTSLIFCRVYIYIYADAFIQSDLHCIQVTVFYILSALAFPGNRTHDLAVASAMLYHLSYRKACSVQRTGTAMVKD